MAHIDLVIRDILNTINDLLEVKNKDKAYMNIVKGVLKRLYTISKENNIEDVAFELQDMEGSFEDVNEDGREKYIEKLIKVKNIIEQRIIEKNRILIFPDSDEVLNGLINKLKQNNIEVILSKGDAVDAIFAYNPNAVIIQNNKNINAVTILKSIREEKILEQIPIIVISDEDYNTKIECLKLGVIDYINYNFDVEEVYLKLLNIVNMSSKCLSLKNTVYDIATGLYTRKQGEILASSLLIKAQREEKDGTLLLIDFDFMEDINKKLGLSFGNRIINKVVSEFKKYTTKVDIAYRMSGDEFAFIFYDRDIKWVKNVAEQVLSFAKQYGDELQQNISFSAGISSITEDNAEYKDILVRARGALAVAKMEGRGRVVVDVDSVKQNNMINILFVDDDRIILSILKSRYKNKGYNVFTASDGLEALEILKENDIDLVVTDYYLKLMNGDELIKKIRENNSDIPIIVLSSQKNEDYIKRTLDLGADDYVVKPFSPVELDSRIKKLLD
ncbi:MAG: response regulator receiver modulated diguanylate cyclase [Caloramator sp.]|jgi:diguanylate cyclase (GGDEF)-like protein|uniref:response regulator n=1 Tax=Caloramator sp. TaxID=1871330 RepID=UPI001D6A568B|nr:response regulator [Caloramator sp.]MBZ4663618.1 response regulator receiver modulated diguanylate cyclase [Caloramator sp.]